MKKINFVYFLYGVIGVFIGIFLVFLYIETSFLGFYTGFPPLTISSILFYKALKSDFEILKILFSIFFNIIFAIGFTILILYIKFGKNIFPF